jgi:hypothetical protein
MLISSLTETSRSVLGAPSPHEHTVHLEAASAHLLALIREFDAGE